MQKKSFLLRILNCIFFLSCFLLAGCQITSKITDEEKLADFSPQPCSNIMDISGRISMHYLYHDKSESLHGKFNWESYPDQTHIEMISPLGQTLATIDIFPHEAVFTRSGHPPVHAYNAETLIFYHLGWIMPISGMQHWLQGCAIDNQGQFFQASPDNPELITQHGWHIRYVNWTLSPENKRIPRRIDMTYSPADKKTFDQLQIRLIIDEWKKSN